MPWLSSDPAMSNQSPGPKGAAAKQQMADASPKYQQSINRTSTAKNNMDYHNKPTAPLGKAKAVTSAAKKAESDNQIAKSKASTEKASQERAATTAKNEKAAALENADTITETQAANDERIAELKATNTPESRAVAKKLEQTNSDLDDKKEIEMKKAMDAQHAEANAEQAAIDAQKKVDEAEAKEDKLEVDVTNAEASQKAEQALVQDDIDAYNDAVKEEEEIKDKLVEEYPEVYSELNDEMEAAKKEDAALIKDKKAKDAKVIRDKKLEETKVERERLQAIAAEKIRLEKIRIAKLVTELNAEGTSLARKQELSSELYSTRAKVAEITKDVNSDINELTANSIKSLLTGESNDGVFLHWDSPQSKGATGKLEDIIVEHMQPKYKHAYMGEFPTGLKDLDWMIKTMDRPKVDVESIEQLRFNVKRNYPVKYNVGDVSITFWDDVHHKTISQLYEYFSTQVWVHSAAPNTGTFKLRDSIIIPYFKVYDLSVDGEDQLEYTFENAVLNSFDFDAQDDEADEGVFTVQAVFKVERFNIIKSKSPRVLNPSNNPAWR